MSLLPRWPLAPVIKSFSPSGCAAVAVGIWFAGAVAGLSVKVHSAIQVALASRAALVEVYPLWRAPADVKAGIGLANKLTALRLFLIAPLVWALYRSDFLLAATVFTLAVITDLADGPIARARNEASVLGGFFDHSVDALFVAAGLLALALSGAELSGTELTVPWGLPVLVLLSFTQYALDSKVLAGRALRASALGRYNGIGYFVVLGIAVIGALVFPMLGLSHALLAQLVTLCGWALVITTLLSMLDRLLAYRTARGSP